MTLTGFGLSYKSSSFETIAGDFDADLITKAALLYVNLQLQRICDERMAWHCAHSRSHARRSDCEATTDMWCCSMQNLWTIRHCMSAKMLSSQSVLCLTWHIVLGTVLYLADLSLPSPALCHGRKIFTVVQLTALRPPTASLKLLHHMHMVHIQG